MKHDARLFAPVWRHDAYTLRGLAAAIVGQLRASRAAGDLGTGSTVVDLGSGSAPYRSLFEEGGATYLACDIEPGPGVDIQIGSEGRTPLDRGSADMVVSFQVLEHVWSLDDYLQECRRVLRPTGQLLLSTHGTWLYHPHPTDFRRWTREGLVRELTSRGYEVLSVRPVVGPLAWTTQFRTLAYWHVLSRLGAPGRCLAAVLCVAMYARMCIEDALTPAGLLADNAAVYVVLARPLA